MPQHQQTFRARRLKNAHTRAPLRPRERKGRKGCGRKMSTIPAALSEYFPSILPLPLICDILKYFCDIVVLTEPEIGPSWADFPLTLKLRKSDQSLFHSETPPRKAYVTPLGALDLTSRLAAVVW